MHLSSLVKFARRNLAKGLGFRVSIHGVGQGRIGTGAFEAQRKLIAGLHIGAPLIFDVGAHHGETIKKYRKAFPQCRVVSFEPTPSAFEILQRKWGNDRDVKLINKAVTRMDGPVDFYVNSLDATNSTLLRPSAGRRYYPRTATAEGKVIADGISLDSFLGDGEVPAILKMDIQGGELAALEGARRSIESSGLKLIYTESMFVPHYETQPLLRDIWNYLADYGYSLYNIFNLHVATNGQLRYGDALFVSMDVRQQCIDTMAEEP